LFWPFKQIENLIMDNKDLIQKNENDDGIDRAGFIKCMAWAGTGVLWLMSGGSLKAFGMSQLIDKHTGRLKNNLSIPYGDFSFVQISDSHIGFSKPANPDVTGRYAKPLQRSMQWPGFLLLCYTQAILHTWHKTISSIHWTRN